jgi:hypothetical protein
MVTVQLKVPPADVDPPEDGHWTAMLTLPPLDVLVEVVVLESELVVSVEEVDTLDWVVVCVVPLLEFALKPEAKK